MKLLTYDKCYLFRNDCFENNCSLNKIIKNYLKQKRKSALFLIIWSNLSLREMSPNTELFVVRIFLYSDRTQKNTDQKYLRIWTHFMQCMKDVSWAEKTCSKHYSHGFRRRLPEVLYRTSLQPATLLKRRLQHWIFTGTSGWLLLWFTSNEQFIEKQQFEIFLFVFVLFKATFSNIELTAGLFLRIKLKLVEQVLF